MDRQKKIQDLRSKWGRWWAADLKLTTLDERHKAEGGDLKHQVFEWDRGTPLWEELTADQKEECDKHWAWCKEFHSFQSKVRDKAEILRKEVEEEGKKLLGDKWEENLFK